MDDFDQFLDLISPSLKIQIQMCYFSSNLLRNKVISGVIEKLQKENDKKPMSKSKQNLI